MPGAPRGTLEAVFDGNISLLRQSLRLDDAQ